MDTSKEYILMCEEAEDIQIYGSENFNKLRPSFVFDKLLDRVSIAIWVPSKMRERLAQKNDEVIVSIEDGNESKVFIEEGVMGEVVWLPRQDQLQDMLEGLHPKPFYAVMKFMDTMMLDDRYYNANTAAYAVHYDNDPKPVQRYQFTSMEQLWLAFVMKEKFGKTWNGKAWEDVNETK